MAQQILKTYLSPDIVDYCVLSYLLPSKDDFKIKYDGLLEEFKKLLDRAEIEEYDFFGDIIYKDDSIVLAILRNKYYNGKNWWRTKNWFEYRDKGFIHVLNV